MSFNKVKTEKPRLVLVSSNGSSSQAPIQQPIAQNIIAKHLAYSQIIKTVDLKNAPDSEAVQVNPFTPSEVKGKRAAVLPVSRTSNSQPRLALDGLKQNLKTLNDLQARLRFMLTELEDIVQK